MEPLNEMCAAIHKAAKEKGFYDEPRETGTLLMLIVSELSEALEADRRDLHADVYSYEHTGKDSESFRAFMKNTFEDEIADAVIRLMDLCGYMGIDLDYHIREKLAYNKQREYKHGKNY